jgi:hypothetical protein
MLVRLELLQHLVTVHFRHHHVEQHQIRAPLIQELGASRPPAASWT